MSDLWKVDVTQWWLPNNEGYPPIIRALRDFIDFRAMSAGKQPDAKDASVRDMIGIFKTMNIEDQNMPDHVVEMIGKGGGWSEGSGVYDRGWNLCELRIDRTTYLATKLTSI